MSGLETRRYFTPGGAIDVTTNDNFPELPGQLSLDPIMPKEGSVKASVLHLLQAHPDGMCRRDFANEDIYEVSNRIGELEADGWAIVKGRCEWHNHRQRFTLYSL